MKTLFSNKKLMKLVLRPKNLFKKRCLSNFSVEKSKLNSCLTLRSLLFIYFDCQLPEEGDCILTLNSFNYLNFFNNNFSTLFYNKKNFNFNSIGFHNFKINYPLLGSSFIFKVDSNII